MFAVIEGGEAMFYGGDQIAGAFNDHVDGRVRNQCAPVLGYVGAAAFHRFIE